LPFRLQPIIEIMSVKAAATEIEVIGADLDILS
jgi:hypothetical protein